MPTAQPFERAAELLRSRRPFGKQSVVRPVESVGETCSEASWSRKIVSPGISSTGWMLKDRFPGDAAHFQIDPVGWLEIHGTPIKENRLGRVFSIPVSPQNHLPGCFVKERRYCGGFVHFVQRLRLSGLRRAARLAPYLRFRGVPTPAQWGFITLESREETREYLVTESISEGRSLSTFLEEEYSTLRRDERTIFRRLLAEKMADLVAGLHLAGCENRDLKATNLVLAEPLKKLRTSNRVDLFLIDLEGVRRLGYIPRFRRERDITRLNLSLLIRDEFTHADRARFLTRYESLMGGSGWKGTWSRLTRSTERRLSTASRIGKPIH